MKPEEVPEEMKSPGEWFYEIEQSEKYVPRGGHSGSIYSPGGFWNFAQQGSRFGGAEIFIHSLLRPCGDVENAVVDRADKEMHGGRDVIFPAAARALESRHL